MRLITVFCIFVPIILTVTSCRNVEVLHLSEGETAFDSPTNLDSWELCNSSLKPRFVSAPDETFTLLLFPECAHGVYGGLLYSAPLTSPEVGSWTLSDRYWSTDDWSRDVSSYAWSVDGTTLLIATNGVYGIAAVHAINPLTKANQILLSERQNSKWSGATVALENCKDVRSKICAVFTTSDEKSWTVDVPPITVPQ